MFVPYIFQLHAIFYFFLLYWRVLKGLWNECILLLFLLYVFSIYFLDCFCFALACIVQHLTFSPFYCRSRSESGLLLLLLRPSCIYLLYSYYVLSKISCCCSVGRCVASLWGSVITSSERFTSTAIVLSMHSSTQHIGIIFIFWCSAKFDKAADINKRPFENPVHFLNGHSFTYIFGPERRIFLT